MSPNKIARAGCNSRAIDQTQVGRRFGRDSVPKSNRRRKSGRRFFMAEYVFKNCTTELFLNVFKLVRSRGLVNVFWPSSDGIRIQIAPSTDGFWILGDPISEKKVYLKDIIEIEGNVIVPFNYSDGTEPAEHLIEFMEQVKQELSPAQNQKTLMGRRPLDDEEWEYRRKQVQEIRQKHNKKPEISIKKHAELAGVPYSTFTKWERELKKKDKKG